MSFVCVAGSVVLGPEIKGWRNAWVFVTDPDEDGCVLMVVWKKQNEWTADTTVIHQGEHAQTAACAHVVDYLDARIECASTVEGLVKTGAISALAPLSDALLRRMQIGVTTSNVIKRKFKDYASARLA